MGFTLSNAVHPFPNVSRDIIILIACTATLHLMRRDVEMLPNYVRKTVTKAKSYLAADGLYKRLS